MVVQYYFMVQKLGYSENVILKDDLEDLYDWNFFDL